MNETLDAAATTQNSAETSVVDSSVADGQEQSTTTNIDEGSTSKSDTAETAAEQAEEAKPEGAPEKYEFVEPEGAKFDPAVLDTFSEVAKELNLSQENAQKVLDKMGPVMAERQAEAVKAIHEQWVADAKADKEFGGAKLDENLAFAKQAREGLGTPELTAFLNETGLGNHPEVIRFFVRAGKAISNDAFVSGGPNNAPDVSLAQRMYDGMNP
jgi:hypothetical protein